MHVLRVLVTVQTSTVTSLRTEIHEFALSAARDAVSSRRAAAGALRHEDDGAGFGGPAAALARHRRKVGEGDEKKKPVSYSVVVEGVEVKDRSWLLRSYPACFVGSQAVTWLCDNDFAPLRLTCLRCECRCTSTSFVTSLRVGET
jgi:Domain found in Dishevelled, Egl-10, and Pleckstrin (DEP)/Protein of unknown function (DUF4060)